MRIKLDTSTRVLVESYARERGIEPEAAAQELIIRGMIEGITTKAAAGLFSGTKNTGGRDSGQD